MRAMLFAAAIVGGLAAAALFWALKVWLLKKYRRDVTWMRDTFLRFNPDPINAEAYTLIYYAGFALWLMLLLWITPNMVIAVAFWLVSLAVPRLAIEWAWKRHLGQVDMQISQCVTSLANSMRAGLTLVQGITRLAEQAPEPINVEFKIMANQYGYGADMETVIRNAKVRLGLPNFNLFASALLLNREMGGDVSETLTRISKSLDKLHEMHKTVEAHTSEGRTNIKVLLLAPLLLLLMMSIVESEGVGLLFTTVSGWAILIIAGAMSGLGAYLANRIMKSEI